MGWFSEFFAKRSTNSPLTPEQSDLLGKALWVLLRRQVETLGYDLGCVPTQSEFVTLKCRGYLFGLSAGVLAEHGLLGAGREAAMEVFDAACQLVYGPEGRNVAIRSLEDTQKESFRSASEFAIQEVNQIYSIDHLTEAVGLYLYKIGQL